MKYTKKSIILYFIAVLLFGFGTGYIFVDKVNGQKTPSVPVEVRYNEGEYHFINPLLFLSTSKSLYTDQYKVLTDSLNGYVQTAKSSGAVTDESIYFRDMNTGHWTGIGEDDKYRPSSMLKVVTLMATVLLAENGRISLSDALPYTPADTNLQQYPPDDGLKAGPQTIQSLAKATVLYSDIAANDALLADKIINSEFVKTYTLFRLPITADVSTDFMSPRSYSVLWRSLYNATFLSSALSEQVLELLSGTTFKDGLVAGVPATTTISHKFGEYTLKLSDGSVVNRELHDCGIVYYPVHPYLLCVMTRGSDFPSLAKTIADTSAIVYRFVSSQTSASN
jgi:beta-lactamase class A